jgi:pimeloyl-ACP methyl ester carboxylesterase
MLVAAILLLASMQPKLAQAESAFIELPNLRLWVVDTGGTGEAIILLHPLTATSEIWEKQISAFAQAGYRVIAPDKPGWGKSVLASGAKPAPYADTIDALADRLKLGKFHLVGVANGGYTALDYAAWKPERLKTLVFGATGLGVQVDDEGKAFRANAAIPGFANLPPEVRELSPSYRGMNPAGVKRWLEIERNSMQPGAIEPPMRTPNTVAKLAKLAMPILVVAGDVDLTTPSGAIRLWAKHLKAHEFALIPEAGHVLMWEQPDAFNTAILGFLKGK